MQTQLPGLQEALQTGPAWRQVCGLRRGAARARAALAALALAAWLAAPLAAGSPSSADGTLAQARELLARGDAAAALQRVEQALQDEPANAQLQFLQGVALMDLGHDTRALAIFEQMHQRYPELPEPLNNIGLLQARAGRLESARQTLLEALRADPQHRAARSNLGQVHLMLAVQAWEAATAGATQDVSMLRRLEAARALLAQTGR
jgi:Flp pilus assembly protein TadD